MVILLTGEYSNRVHMWTEYVCMEIGATRVVLSSRTYEHLSESEEFGVWSEDGFDLQQLPLTIHGRRVKGLDYTSVVGTELIVSEEIHLSRGEYERAQGWLEEREWRRKDGFEHAWRRIETALRSVERDPNEPEPDQTE
jgi:hypothetical protein